MSARKRDSLRTIARGRQGPIGFTPLPAWGDDVFLSFRDANGNPYGPPPVNLQGPEGPAGDFQNFKTRTRAIGSIISPALSSIRVERFATGYPLAPAIYIPGSPAGPMAFQELGGHWWELDLTNQIPDIAWFGANSFDGAANAAAFRAIAALSKDGGSTGYPIRVGPGSWPITGPVIQFTQSNNKIIGAGSSLTFMAFTPSTPFDTMFRWYRPGSAGGLSFCNISGVRIYRNKDAFPATALELVNTSGFQISDVLIHNWHDTSGANSIGIYLRGREITKIVDSDVTADSPIFIDENPERSLVGREDCDFLSIRNAQLSSLGSDAGKSPIFFRDGVNVANFSIENFDLSGGQNGIEWQSTADNLALSQSRGSAGNLVLNGQFVSGGVGFFNVARQVGITAPASDNSGVTFTVVGTSKTGSALTNILAGPNHGTVFTTDDFKTITSISVSAATVGNVMAGKTCESVAQTFSVRLGRQEQVAVPGGAMVFISRPNVFELRGVEIAQIACSNGGVSLTGNISGATVTTLYHGGVAFPPFVIDGAVSDFEWRACLFLVGAPNGISGQTIISDMDKRAGEPHARSGRCVRTAVATLPNASSGYSVAGTQVLGPRATGWNAPTGSASRGAFDSGATLGTTAATLAALIADLRAHGLIGS